MKSLFSHFFRASLILSLCILSILSIGILTPLDAQAANFGSLTDNGTAAYMGIGIATAVRPLHLFGNVALFERAQDSAGFIIQRTDPNRWVLGVNESPALGHGFVLSTYPVGETSSTPRLLVTPTGNVGIGTINPIRKLQVEDSTGAAIYGKNTTDNNTGFLGSGSYGAYGRFGESGPYGYMGSEENGVYGEAQTGSQRAVYGKHTGSQNYGYLADDVYGVYGQADSGGDIGVYGKYKTGGYGYLGSEDHGVYGNGQYGVYGYSPTGYGIYGKSTGNAGYFEGIVHISSNLYVDGTVTKGGGSFKIDHPQDAENRYLQHSFVESPEMKNVYDGTIVLDDNGEAVVRLPSYFESLNRDFRYQLTCIGGYAPVYVAEKVSSNHFKIAGGKPGMEVSWQVTGIRQDAFAKAHPIIVEQEKPANEKGYYLHPTEWGQPVEKGIAQLNK